MQPVQVLVRQIIVLIVAFLIAKLVALGVVSIDDGATLAPLLVEAINYYLPFLLPALAGLAHYVYATFIAARLYKTARNSPQRVPDDFVPTEALGKGRKRKAAKLLLGIK